MLHIILPNLQLVFFFVYTNIKSFKKVFIYCITISSIIVYHTTIIINILNKVADYIKFKIVNG